MMHACIDMPTMHITQRINALCHMLRDESYRIVQNYLARFKKKILAKELKKQRTQIQMILNLIPISSITKSISKNSLQKKKMQIHYTNIYILHLF